MKLFTIVFLITFFIATPDTRGESPAFTKNVGQLDTHGKADCRFYTNVGGANYFFCADGVVSDFQQYSSDVIARSGAALAQATKQSVGVERIASLATHDAANGLYPVQRDRNDVIKGHVLKLNFIGRTNFLAEVTGEDEQSYNYNYFIGNDRKKWHTDVHNYSRIMYKNVWEGIDVKYYVARSRTAGSRNEYRDLTSRATMEYDVIVHPGADPTLVQFSYEGDEGISVNNEGSLIIKTSIGDVIEQKPYVYQIIDGEKKERCARFLKSGISGFTFVLGEYDKTKDLVIDPQLTYSTYLGGSGDDVAWGIATDKAGLIYVTGQTESANFPTRTGAYDTTYHGNMDVFVSKIDPVSGKLLFSTFLGGDSLDRAWCIALGPSPEGEVSVYVAGTTMSSNFPTTPGAYDGTYNGTSDGYSGDAFVARLTREGNSLIYSTYLGGALSDYVLGLTIDDLGNAYVVGRTLSVDFPVSLTALQVIKGGGYDAFVTKINSSGSALLFSTYFGGNEGDDAYSVALGQVTDHGTTGPSVFVTGSTRSTNLPTTPGVFQPTKAKTNPSCYITKINATGDTILYCTYLGGASANSVNDQAFAIKVDAHGNAYVTGRAFSKDFPVTANAYQITKGLYVNAFLTELDSTASNLLYSTFFGGRGDNSGDAGLGIDIDKNGFVYLVGQTFDSSDPLFPTTSDAYQSKAQGAEDGFVAKFDPSASGNSSLVYSTIFGRGSTDIATTVAIGDSGRLCIAGLTQSSNFPLTSNAFQQQFKGGSGSWWSDAFVSVFQFEHTTTGVRAEENERDENVFVENYPNPFSRSTVIALKASVVLPATFEVRDLLGRQVYSQKVESRLFRFDAAGLPRGAYFYSVMNGERRFSRMMMHLP